METCNVGSRNYSRLPASIAFAHNQETAKLTEGLQALQAFTKKPDGESEPSSLITAFAGGFYCCQQLALPSQSMCAAPK